MNNCFLVLRYIMLIYLWRHIHSGGRRSWDGLFYLLKESEGLGFQFSLLFLLYNRLWMKIRIKNINKQNIFPFLSTNLSHNFLNVPVMLKIVTTVNLLMQRNKKIVSSLKNETDYQPTTDKRERERERVLTWCMSFNSCSCLYFLFM